MASEASPAVLENLCPELEGCVRDILLEAAGKRLLTRSLLPYSLFRHFPPAGGGLWGSCGAWLDENGVFQLSMAGIVATNNNDKIAW
jgi:hypothetical protein